LTARPPTWPTPAPTTSPPSTTATNTAGTNVTVGTGPAAVAITPDGKTAYVANFGATTVTPINTATNTVGTNITVGTNASGIAITPGPGAHLFIHRRAGAAWISLRL